MTGRLQAHVHTNRLGDNHSLNALRSAMHEKISLTKKKKITLLHGNIIYNLHTVHVAN